MFDWILAILVSVIDCMFLYGSICLIIDVIRLHQHRAALFADYIDTIGICIGTILLVLLTVRFWMYLI